MYQDNNQRKWQSPPASNPPLDNLKSFLQKRIKAIMAKEWWDFIVNVNTLNSDHASLLYSLANLCPSFTYFLKSKDKELQLIIKKRPFVKPRIFSGSERIDTAPEPIVPKQLPLVTRRNSASELVKILNELYPNENANKNKLPRSSGPASKQKKAMPGPNKKSLACNISKDLNKKSSPPNVSVGRSPLLTRLLADESQKENAHVTTIKKLVQPQHSLSVLHLEGNNEFYKTILSNTNYDLNQNKLISHSPRKIRKIIKVKKKRYVYSSAHADPKNRLKYILEDETPDLSLKLIKKYRIKKCSVNLVRLKDSVIEYYNELKNPRLEVSTLETPVNSPLSEENSDMPSTVINMSNDKIVSTSSLPIKKDSETSENTVSHKDNVTSSEPERLDPTELKNMYYHGGIVPLGKALAGDRTNDFRSKHFLSLKEKKVKDIIDDTIENVLKSKDANLQAEEIEIEKRNNCAEHTSALNPITPDNNPNINKSELDSDEKARIGNKTLPNINPIISAEDKLDTSEISQTNSTEPTSDNQENVSKLLSVFPNSTNGSNKTDSETNVLCKERRCEISETNSEPIVSIALAEDEVSRLCTEEAPLDNKSTNISEMEVENYNKSEEDKSNHAVFREDVLLNSIDQSEFVEKLSIEIPKDKTIISTKYTIEDPVINSNEELEPSAKRPRIEINLTEMKLQVTKTIVESEKELLSCKMCKVSFDNRESWSNHFENSMPKCTPNLKVSWDKSELSL